MVEVALAAAPLVYVHSLGHMVPGLERQLAGKRVGAELRLEVAAADGYGEYDPAAEHAAPRSQLPLDADIEQEDVFPSSGAAGSCQRQGASNRRRRPRDHDEPLLGGTATDSRRPGSRCPERDRRLGLMQPLLISAGSG